MSVDQEGGDLDFNNWVNRGMAVRGGHSVYQCLANLTAALEFMGQLNAAEYNGAAGALSLLPAAGALLGSPTHEMWIVYKLVSVAGVLSMFLSLGGSITPSNVSDYSTDHTTYVREGTEKFVSSYPFVWLALETRWSQQVPPRFIITKPSDSSDRGKFWYGIKS